MAEKKIAKHAEADKPEAKLVLDFHTHSDLDGGPKAQHHTLGPAQGQAAAGNHTHDGGNSALLDKLMEDITISGSRGGNDALTNLLTALSNKFGLTDTTTP